MFGRFWSTFMLALFLIGSSFLSLQGQGTQVKVVVFDFGSVIVKTDRQRIVQFLTQSLNISDEQAHNALHLRKINTDSGIDEDLFWKNYVKDNALDLPSDWLSKLDEVKLSALHEIPGMITLVKDLQRQGYQTALLSNVRGSQAAIKGKLGLYKLFHPVLLSYEIGAKKPDPKAFKILLNQLKVSPQSVLFVDNKQANVDAAKKMGIDAILFINTDLLVQELKKRGIEVTLSSESKNILTH